MFAPKDFLNCIGMKTDIALTARMPANGPRADQSCSACDIHWKEMSGRSPLQGIRCKDRSLAGLCHNICFPNGDTYNCRPSEKLATTRE
jgi:hypothetical protein